MKNTYIFLLIYFTLFLKLMAQAPCHKAYAHVVYAVSYSESALEANTIDHVKQFAYRSETAFVKAQSLLDNCICDSVEEMINDAIRNLSKIRNLKVLEQIYYYANKGKKLADATMAQLDNCTESFDGLSSLDVNVESGNTINELASIEAVQNNLLKQHEALKRKQAELQQQLADRKQQELILKKEQLISELEVIVASNTKAFNEALNVYGCQEGILKVPFQKEELQKQSIAEIKASTIDIIKNLTAHYIKQLENCTEVKTTD